MTHQEGMPERDPVAEWFEIHGHPSPFQGQPLLPFNWPAEPSRWTNGVYAFAAIAAGLIVMVLLSIPAGASGTAKKKHPGTKVQAIEQRSDAPKCLDPVRVVGSQDIREDAAEESARKAWAEMVRWESGESFMQLENATGYQKRCSRSSIGEALGQVLNRCEIVAKPCRPGLVSKGDGK